MRLFLLISWLTTALFAEAQETRFISHELVAGFKEEFNARINDTTIRENSYKAIFNGILFCEGQYKAGERTGLWKFYHYPSGKLEYSYDYSLKQFIGEYKRYHETGKTESSCFYADGLREGEQRTYFDDGSLMQTNSFKKGKEDGNSKHFTNAGKTEFEKNYRDGRLNGISTFYFTMNSDVALKLEYSDGKLLQILALNDSTGKPLNPGSFKNGTGIRNYYYKNNMLQYSYQYKDGIQQGTFNEYRMDGSLFASGFYLEDKRTGIWKFYLHEGTTHSVYDFDKDSLLLLNKEADEKLPEFERNRIARLQKRKSSYPEFAGSAAIPAHTETSDTRKIRMNGNASSSEEIFIVVEMPARFPGGDQELINFLRLNIEYPEYCKMNKIKGISYITFVVEKDGSISNLKTIKSSHILLDQEAMRIISLMPRWQPGMMQGVPVRVSCSIPIKFALR